MNRKRFQFLLHKIRVFYFRNINAQHGMFFVSDQALHFNMPQGGSRQNSSRQFQNLGQIFFSIQFIQGGPADHPFHRHLSVDGRH